MVEIDVVNWYRTVLLLALAYCMVALTVRYARAFKDISTAQKLYIGALLCFTLSPVIGNIESIIYGDGFRFRLIPSTVGLFLLFAYLMEPHKQNKKRWGREPYDPKGPGEL
jgi:hypothetical protein